MSRKTNKEIHKEHKGSNVYAQNRLPHCDGCGKKFVTLKVTVVNGKSVALCADCQTVHN